MRAGKRTNRVIVSCCIRFGEESNVVKSQPKGQSGAEVEHIEGKPEQVVEFRNEDDNERVNLAGVHASGIVLPKTLQQAINDEHAEQGKKAVHLNMSL